MKIYTRSGDDGETGLFGGGRVLKSHIRVSAYGAVDEVNAALGMAVATVGEGEIATNLTRIQADLFSLGASLATPGAQDGTARPETPALPLDRIREMEAWIDAATEETPPLTNFILPGGSQGAAILHLARTICRRAERSVVHLGKEEPIDGQIIQYLNRLSDLLFAYARLENHRRGFSDLIWRVPRGGGHDEIA